MVRLLKSLEQRKQSGIYCAANRKRSGAKKACFNCSQELDAISVKVRQSVINFQVNRFVLHPFLQLTERKKDLCRVNSEFV